MNATETRICRICGRTHSSRPDLADLLCLTCERNYLLETLSEIAGMCEEGRLSVAEVVGARVGSGGQPSRMIDAAAAVTRGHFLAIGGYAEARLQKLRPDRKPHPNHA